MRVNQWPVGSPCVPIGQFVKKLNWFSSVPVKLRLSVPVFTVFLPSSLEHVAEIYRSLDAESVCWCGAGISSVDVGNYTCEVGGPQNAVLASVTHQLYVRGTWLVDIQQVPANTWSFRHEARFALFISLRISEIFWEYLRCCVEFAFRTCLFSEILRETLRISEK